MRLLHRLNGLLDGLQIYRGFAKKEENLDYGDRNQNGYDDDQEHTIHDLIPDMGFRIPGFDSSSVLIMHIHVIPTHLDKTAPAKTRSDPAVYRASTAEHCSKRRKQADGYRSTPTLFPSRHGAR